MKKVALVTGANKGIGFEVAKQLGQAGFTILLGARERCQGREGSRQTTCWAGLIALYVPVDLNQAAESATALVKQIDENFGHLGMCW